MQNNRSAHFVAAAIFGAQWKKKCSFVTSGFLKRREGKYCVVKKFASTNAFRIVFEMGNQCLSWSGSLVYGAGAKVRRPSLLPTFWLRAHFVEPKELILT